jgi:hypothetical protein
MPSSEIRTARWQEQVRDDFPELSRTQTMVLSKIWPPWISGSKGESKARPSTLSGTSFM